MVKVFSMVRRTVKKKVLLEKFYKIDEMCWTTRTR